MEDKNINNDEKLMEQETQPQYTEEENEEYDRKIKAELNREMFQRLFKDLYTEDPKENS